MKRRKKFITSDPGILGGKPIIAGTRIPVARVVHLLKEGYTIEAIHQEYPHVEIKSIAGTVSELETMLNDNRNASKIFQT